MNIEMDGRTIKTIFRHATVQDKPLITYCLPPNPPTQRLTEKELRNPHVPGGYMTKEELFSSELKEICAEGPIVFIRNIADALKIDLTLFSSSTLKKTEAAEEACEIRTQFLQGPCENWKVIQTSTGEVIQKSWYCYNYRSYMKMNEYVKYQYEHLFQSLPRYLKRSMDKSLRRGCTRKVVMEDVHNNIYNMEFSYASDTFKDSLQKVKFAINVDLADEEMWKPQLQELSKLPPLLRVVSDDNMLSYLDYKILGMNTVQLYMNVPGCRITGRQDDNNFSTVNINCGPGFCEWFVVPYEYWGMMLSLCERNRIAYLHDSWWPPDLDVLYDNNIPVYKCLQRSGDLIWVNAGSIYWVQAVGWCNTISWNVGPFTARQYQLALERYEWNKLKRYQSIVPIVQLSWKLAHRVKVSDLQLFILIKNCLLQTLIKCFLLEKFVKDKNIKMYKVKHSNYYCKCCKIELFNYSFTKNWFNCEKRKVHNLFCSKCVSNQVSDFKKFVCLQKYSINELLEIYDAFRLDTPMTLSSLACATEEFKNNSISIALINYS